MRARAMIVTLAALSVLSSYGRAPAAPGSERPSAASQEAEHAGADERVASKAVLELAEQLKRRHLQPATTVDHLDLYMIDVERGETTLVASQPDQGFDRCGSPAWSNDGRRIVYDAMPGDAVPLTVIKSISAGKDGPTVTELGLGNCPSFSADGDRIIFLNNSGEAPNGIWLMQADGSNRRPLQGYGRTKWSPDGHRFLVVAFNVPCTVTVIDDRPDRKSGRLEIAGKKTFPDPNWAGDGIIVAPIGVDAAEAIALVDVSKPEEAEVKETLWTRGKDLDVEPSFPVYSARNHRVVFVGLDNQKKKALYSFERGKKAPPRRLEPGVQSKEIRDLAPSPDGRYVLFSSNRGEEK